MSLLLDALKQAETQRKQAQESAGLSLEPVAAQADTRQQSAPKAPESALRPATRATPSALRKPDASVSPRAIFQAKQRQDNRLPLILGVLALLLFAAGATYVWWETQPRGMEPGPAFAQAAAPAALPPGPDPARTTPEAPPPTSASRLAAGIAAPADAAALASDSAAAGAAPRPDRAARVEAPRPSGAVRSTAPAPAIESGTSSERHAAPEPASTGPEATSPLSVRRGGTQQPAPPALRAFASYQAGDFVLAREQYLEALRLEPRNIDTLNALGMLALRSGQTGAAEAYFRQTLIVDPKDSLAASQLALLYAEGDAVAAESRLRTLLASQPESAPLHFALGSVFARQARWREAQQMFFQAHTLDNENPDILFNLAVSLDQLQQSDLARQFYERALAASTRRAAGFDAAAVQRRLHTLGSAAARPAP